MCPFTKTGKEKRPNFLKPGESWIFTEGPAGSIWHFGAACNICGKEFEYSLHSPGGIFSVGYNHYDFGKYNPQRIWFCRTHSNKEIEKKIKELDI